MTKRKKAEFKKLDNQITKAERWLTKGRDLICEIIPFPAEETDASTEVGSALDGLDVAIDQMHSAWQEYWEEINKEGE